MRGKSNASDEKLANMDKKNIRLHNSFVGVRDAITPSRHFAKTSTSFHA